ncbi:MAG: tRNA dihydrouridine(20/20a) synthase DusA [Proteobacteria bacterium]|nr:tRNA dihydrouridine(20/20a) synthase DusA [Pseudomonadota bacterium]
MTLKLNRKLSIAPMMDHTDRHFRFFMRIISPHAMLYTEMITTGALIHGDRQRFLEHHVDEYPLAIQLGGSDPEGLAACAVIAEEAGYGEVNLNVGCPSERVQSGKFGACLMAEPELVAEGISRMSQSVNIPVTVKTRIGIDDQDSYEELSAFINCVKNAGCNTFIIHARKAWLNGLSPKENREVPPLQYETVYQLKNEFPEIDFIINGGFTTQDSIMEQYAHVDGVMIGRATYQNPYLLAEIEQSLFGNEASQPTRYEILENFMDYVQQNLDQGVYLGHMSRHILGLFLGQPGARAYRRYISENAYREGAGVEVIRAAMEKTL